MKPDREFSAWLAIEWLSLDRMLPRYTSAGVAVSDPQLVMTMSRDIVRAKLNAELTSQGNKPPGDLSVNLGEFIESVSEALGEEESQGLLHWIRFVHCVENSNPWVPLKAMFAEWSAACLHRGVDFLGFECDAQLLARKYHSEVVEAGLGDRVRRPRIGELSEWDASLFMRRGFAEIADDSDFVPFEDEFDLAATMHRFQKFTCSVLRSLSTQDLHRVDTKMSRLLLAQPWPGMANMPGMGLLTKRLNSAG